MKRKKGAYHGGGRRGGGRRGVAAAAHAEAGRDHARDGRDEPHHDPEFGHGHRYGGAGHGGRCRYAGVGHHRQALRGLQRRGTRRTVDRRDGQGDAPAELEQSEAELASCKTEYEYQTKNYARTRTLHEKELVSDAEYDEAFYQYESRATPTNRPRRPSSR